MGKLYDRLTPELEAFILAQRMFFVATAPEGLDGHINLSPKGFAGSFAILGEREVAYLDLMGSGIETVAHLRENGRITLMFCAFEGAPNIVRLYGRGEVVLRGDADFEGLSAKFSIPVDAARSLIRVRLTRIADSCGYGVPLYEHRGTQDRLRILTDMKPEGVKAYVEKKNAESIDGLTGIKKVGLDDRAD